MRIQLIILFLVVSAVVSFLAAAISQRRGATLRSRSFTILMLATGWWSLTFAGEIMATDLAGKLWMIRLEFIGIVAIAPAWLTFTWRQAGFRQTLTSVQLTLLLLIPALTLLAAWTTPRHALIYTRLAVTLRDGHYLLDRDFGPLFFLFIGYSYLLLMLGTAITAWRFTRATGIYRWQSAALLAAVLAPWVINMLSIGGIPPFAVLDLTPVGFTITGVVFLVALFRLGLFNLVPVARDIVIENLEEAIMVIDHEERILDVNPAARRSLNAGQEMMIGKPVMLALTSQPDLLEQYQEARTARRFPSNPLDHETAMRVPKSNQQLSLLPLQDWKKHSTGSVVVIREISAQRQLASLYTNLLAMTRTRDLSSLLQMLVEQATELLQGNSGDVYLALSEQRQVRCVVSYRTSRNYDGNLMQYGEGVSGTIAETAAPLIVNDYPAWERRAAAYADEPTVHSVIGAPLIWQGQVTGVLAVMRGAGLPGFSDEDLHQLVLFASQAAVVVDNARLHEAQQDYARILEQRVDERTAALSAANAKLLELDDLKNQFISHVSHELRTPISNIKLYLRLLETGRSEKQPQYLATLRKEADTLQTLIEDILELTRLDLGSKPLALAPVNLNDLVNAWLDHNAAQISLRAHRCETQLEPGLPVIQADAHQMFRILSNLMANALAYSPPGSLVVISTGRQTAAGAAWVTLSVRDEGAGIETGEQTRIFDRFFRGTAARAGQISGAGLGLAIGQEMAHAHGGRITVTSAPGSGSTFVLWLPL